jgi:hypothetical protein
VALSCFFYYFFWVLLDSKNREKILHLRLVRSGTQPDLAQAGINIIIIIIIINIIINKFEKKLLILKNNLIFDLKGKIIIIIINKFEKKYYYY